MPRAKAALTMDDLLTEVPPKTLEVGYLIQATVLNAASN